MKQQFAFPCFFIAASLYAGLVMLLFAAVTTGLIDRPLLTHGHALPLLFGVVSALISGYLLGKTSTRQLILFIALWVACRGIELLAEESLAPLLMNSAFGCMMARQIAPKFTVAKKWRNRSAGPLLAFVLGYPVAYLLLSAAGLPHLHLVVPLVMLLSLLLFYMGGRVITASVSKALTSKGLPVINRTQPRIEGAVIVLLFSGVALHLMGNVTGMSWLINGSGVLAGVSGLLTLVRLLRWQLHQCRHRLDVLLLAAGYTWLGIGLCIVGTRMMLGYTPVISLHFITIGALGTLSTNIMLKLNAQRTPQRVPSKGILVCVTLLMALATVLRISLNELPNARALVIWGAVLAWGLAYWLTASAILKSRLKAQFN